MTWFVQDSSLLDFSHTLSINAKLFEEYKENPEGVMDRFGLSKDEQAQFLSQNKGDLVSAFTNQLDQVG